MHYQLRNKVCSSCSERLHSLFGEKFYCRPPFSYTGYGQQKDVRYIIKLKYVLGHSTGCVWVVEAACDEQVGSVHAAISVVQVWYPCLHRSENEAI